MWAAFEIKAAFESKITSWTKAHLYTCIHVFRCFRMFVPFCNFICPLTGYFFNQRHCIYDIRAKNQVVLTDTSKALVFEVVAQHLADFERKVKFTTRQTGSCEFTDSNGLLIMWLFDWLIACEMKWVPIANVWLIKKCPPPSKSNEEPQECIIIWIYWGTIIRQNYSKSVAKGRAKIKANIIQYIVYGTSVVYYQEKNSTERSKKNKFSVQVSISRSISSHFNCSQRWYLSGI